MPPGGIKFTTHRILAVCLDPEALFGGDWRWMNGLYLRCLAQSQIRDAISLKETEYIRTLYNIFPESGLEVYRLV
jgi:hypothetical protein